LMFATITRLWESLGRTHLQDVPLMFATITTNTMAAVETPVYSGGAQFTEV